MGSLQDADQNGSQQQQSDQRANSGAAASSAGLAACSLSGYAGNAIADPLLQQRSPGLDPQQQNWQSFTQSLQQCAAQQQQQHRHSMPAAADLPSEVDQLLSQMQQQQQWHQQRQEGVGEQGQPSQTAGGTVPEEARQPQAPKEASTRRVLTYQEHLREEELKAQLAERTGEASVLTYT